MPFVLDASIAVAWHLPDESAEYAGRILDTLRGGKALAPAVWPLEVANALVVAERRGRLAPGEASRASMLLSALPIVVRTLTMSDVSEYVLPLALHHGLSIYDASYLAVAIIEGAPLATADGLLRDAAVRAGIPIID